MNSGTLAKLVAVALAAVAGFFASQLAARPERGAERVRPTLPQAEADPAATAAASPGASTDKSVSPRSPKHSPVSKALAFERFLATCELARLREMLEEEFKAVTQHERSSAISNAWMKRDPDGYADWIATQPPMIPQGARGNSFIGIRSSFISELAKADPEAAWRMADRLNDEEHTKWSILLGSLKKDAALALRLAEAHPEVYLSNNWNLGSDHSGIDPMRALPILQALHPGGGRAALANDASNYYAANASDPAKLDEAAAWFEQLPADAQRSVVRKLELDFLIDRIWIQALPKLREIWKLPAEE